MSDVITDSGDSFTRTALPPARSPRPLRPARIHRSRHAARLVVEADERRRIHCRKRSTRSPEPSRSRWRASRRSSTARAPPIRSAASCSATSWRACCAAVRARRCCPASRERWEITPTGATFRLRDNARWSDGAAGHRARLRVRVAQDRRSGQRVGVRVLPLSAEERRSDQPRRTADRIARRARSRRPHARRRFRTADAVFREAGRCTPRTARCARTSTNRATAATAPTPTRCCTTARSASRRGCTARICALEKNPYYWDQDRIKLNVIDMPYVTNDPNAVLNLYKDGKIATAPPRTQRRSTTRWSTAGRSTGSTTARSSTWSSTTAPAA